MTDTRYSDTTLTKESGLLCHLAPQKFFGLTSAYGKPTIVGGIYNPSQVTGRVLTYNKVPNRWEQSIPPMPTSRYRNCAISNNSGIIVAGGLNAKDECISTVEIYLFESNQWLLGTQLPAPRAGLQCTMVRNRVYFMGGCYPSMNTTSNRCNCYYTDYLASENLSDDTPLVWKSLPDLPLPGCAPASMSGILLAIGGSNELNGVHFYDPLTQQWLRIGDLPLYRTSLVVATLPNDQIIVTTGRDGEGVRHNSTFLGCIQIN